jgi:hypothetical protein
MVECGAEADLVEEFNTFTIRRDSARPWRSVGM